MNDLVWYVYRHPEGQTGPFDKQQITRMLDSNMIPQNAYLYKTGWEDWRPLSEALESLGETRSSKEMSGPEKRAHIDRSPRATIKGRIIVHNNGQLIIGGGVNISASGIFIETTDKLFQLGETLKLTCRVDGFLKAFNATAVVTRFNDDHRFPLGYGMKFEELDKAIAREIQALIDQINEHLSSPPAAR
ncbi:MAG: PilZ domain-containing protein [Deltaproteobacteria bacterium]|nr:PilZ domain-containing protein [Deltaproteobacteria bacterium]